MKILKKITVLTTFVCCLIQISVSAQIDSVKLKQLQNKFSNQKSITLKINSDTITIDSLGFYPFDVEILENNQSIKTTDYKLIPEKGQIVWIKRPQNSITINYRKLPSTISGNFAHKLKADNENSFEVFGGSENRNNEEDDYNYSSYNYSALSYTGSFGRGISFGNNQDLVVNSNFNLQLSGVVGNDIEITGAITDNNIPLQPEGNTQQIQDFDKIFIQIKKNRTKLLVGDYELISKKNYFLKLNRNLQGLQFETGYDWKEKQGVKTKFSAAVARGKYTRNIFDGIEGNQGPYKLTGAQNETFIIIEAGTERIYIDGKLMERGSQFDYVIDYNTGEVFFTPNRLITKDSRISIEFEYSERSYLRSLLHNSAEINIDTWKIGFDVYSEQDAKNQPIDGDFEGNERTILNNAGDDLSQAFVSGIDSIPFDRNRVFYEVKDSVSGGILYDSIFVYTTDSLVAKYVLSFSNVGQNNGNYVQAERAVNGRVYKWIAPINGIPQGNFEPIIQLTPPKKQQLVLLNVSRNINKTTKIYGEFAFTNKDNNTFSSLDKQDNQGIAAKLDIEKEHYFNYIKGKQLKLIGRANYELRGKNFNPIENYRPIEFSRDWNKSVNTNDQNEHWANGGLTLDREKWGNISYDVGLLRTKSVYEGLKQVATLKMNRKGFNILAQANFLTTKDSLINTQFNRPKVNITKQFKWLKGSEISLDWFQENNQFRNVLTDTLEQRSFRFDEFKAGTIIGKENDFNVELSFKQRIDQKYKSQNLAKASTANEFSIKSKWSQFKGKGNLNLLFNYRDLTISDTTLLTTPNQKNALGRLQYNLNALKGFLRSNTLYEIGSGQQQKLEFTYVEVPAGEGVYVWVDYNGDNIQTLNEFEQANFQDQANFIRLLTPSNEFERTDFIQFNQTLALNPKAIWFKSTGFKKTLSKFGTNSQISINKKTRRAGESPDFNPFDLQVQDSLLISANASIRNKLYFNRGNNKYNAEYSNLITYNKAALTSGAESRTKNEHRFIQRVGISKSLNIKLKAELGEQNNNAVQFSNKNYQIDFYNLEPSISWIFKQKLRISTTYIFASKKNNINLLEEFKSNEFEIETKYNALGKGNVSLKVEFTKINFTGQENTPVGYVLLAGLRPGNNYQWNLNFDRNIAKNIRLNVAYEGRKTGLSSKIIHVGRAQINAVF